MQKLKLTAIAVAVAAGSQLAVASQQNSRGFLEDSQLTLNTRALHFDRHIKGDDSPRATGLGFNLGYESGYTQGAVGFGVDAFALQGVKLDANSPHNNGIAMFPTKGNDKAKNNYSQAGIALKAQASETSLKVGDQFVDLPVYAMDDSRLLPETTTGGLLTSNELEQLEVHLGHFTKLSGLGHTSRNSNRMSKTSLGGLRFAFNEDFSAAYYFGKSDKLYKNEAAEDVEAENFKSAKKHYINLNYDYVIGEDHSLNADFNAYRSIYSGNGQKKQTNNTRSIALAYNLGAHTLTVARQCVEGDGAYMYGYDGGGAVYLANDIQVHGFHQTGEVSHQIRYDLNMETFGVPGLNLMTRYVRGSKIHANGEQEKGKNWERDIDVHYVVQSGPAKELSLHLRQATYRANSVAAKEGGFGPAGAKIDEVRFIVEYPLSLL